MNHGLYVSFTEKWVQKYRKSESLDYQKVPNFRDFMFLLPFSFPRIIHLFLSKTYTRIAITFINFLIELIKKPWK